MSLEALLTDAVTISPRAQSNDEDDYGDPQLDAAPSFASPARVEFGNFVRSENREDLSGEDSVEIVARIFLPPTVSVSHLDAVTHDGATYEVWGSAEPQHGRTGIHHVQAYLRRIEGG